MSGGSGRHVGIEPPGGWQCLRLLRSRDMPRLQFRRFAEGERRDPPLGKAELVRLGESNIGRARWEPGWRWSEHLKPMMGTDSCPFHHLGYSISGSLHVEMEDGETLDIPPDCAYEIPPGHDAWVVGDEAWVTVEWTSAAEVGIPTAPEERVLATLLFTDIADSTQTLARVGDAAWRDMLLEHNRRIRADLNAHRGREVTTTGDGFLATFDSATRAARCALAMVQSARELGLAIRVGVHTGEIELVGGNARGIAVHTAARVMSLAAGGEIFVSSTTRDLLEGSGLNLEHRGAHELKGLPGARDVYRLIPAPSG
jgi:class 3 adenylate cyclase